MEEVNKYYYPIGTKLSFNKDAAGELFHADITLGKEYIISSVNHWVGLFIDDSGETNGYARVDTADEYDIRIHGDTPCTGSFTEGADLKTRKVGKNQMELVETGFPNAMLALGEVMTWAGSNKGYLPNDWKDAPNPASTFLAAAARHRNKRLIGEVGDEESGLNHLYHEAFNVMAQLELHITGKLK